MMRQHGAQLKRAIGEPQDQRYGGDGVVIFGLLRLEQARIGRAGKQRPCQQRNPFRAEVCQERRQHGAGGIGGVDYQQAGSEEVQHDSLNRRQQ